VTKVKLAIATVLCVVLGGLPALAQQLTGTLKKVKDSGTLVIGYRESSIPFSFYDERQNVIGYSHDICLHVADAVKQELRMPQLQVRYIAVTPQTRISQVQNGAVDLECGSTSNTVERQKQVAFSVTTFIVTTRLLTKKGSGIRDFADLAGKRVVTTSGTTSEPMLRKLNQERNLGMTILVAKDHLESFLTLQKGDAVAFMMDDVLLYGERAKAEMADDWVLAGMPLTYEAYGMMMRKDDPQFKALVDGVISRLETSGEAEKLYKKWFLSPIPPKGFNLNLPMSRAIVELFKHPNDKALQ
jgi:glutamate/aspartate transport system substrate-binding protein